MVNICELFDSFTVETRKYLREISEVYEVNIERDISSSRCTNYGIYMVLYSKMPSYMQYVVLLHI